MTHFVSLHSQGGLSHIYRGTVFFVNNIVYYCRIPLENSVQIMFCNALCKKRGLYFSNWIAYQGEPLSEKCIF